MGISGSYTGNALLTPPAAVLQVGLSTPGAIVAAPVRLDAVIDSGASFCAIPSQYISLLGLQKVDEQLIQSIDGSITKKPIFSVKIHHDALGERIVRAISTDVKIAFLGRNYINYLRILLDGRKQEFEIS